MSIRVLLAEDDETFRVVLTDHLKLRGFDVSSTALVAQARRAALQSGLDVLVLDQKLPDGDGVTLAQELLAAGVQTKIILVTAHADVARAIAATRAGVFDYLQKPVELSVLEDTIRRAARAAQAQSSVSPQVTHTSSSSPPRLVGAGAATQRLRAQLQAAARACPAPVLITGETGAGKGLAARLVHAAGPRSRGPLVVVNCAAIPESMFEAELFGHERGAFTGALQTRPGLFESAHGGTLVLDEIGEVSPMVQSKLLRTLEEGVVRRVGAPHERVVDVRAVATTNRDVETMVNSGAFRRDLYYRIAVVRIDLPPLRDRREDIPLLVNAFLEEFELPMDEALGDRELAFLQDHDWPGNVRELRNVLQRWRIAQQGHCPEDIADLVHPNHGDSFRVQRPGEALGSVIGAEASPQFDQRLPQEAFATAHPRDQDTRAGMASFVDRFATLAELEVRHIHQALARSGNNRTVAAKLLGISRATLRRKLKEEPRDG